MINEYLCIENTDLVQAVLEVDYTFNLMPLGLSSTLRLLRRLIIIEIYTSGIAA